jgi:secondary thiamine-phosphate synthase enzyme
MQEFTISSSSHNELVDITEQVKDIVERSGTKTGICQIYVAHATAGIMINENADPNITLDIIDSLKHNIPEGRWRHDQIDNNAAAHIKAGIIGPSETIPIMGSKLVLGTWQNIFVADFDGPRKRRVLVNIVKG